MPRYFFNVFNDDVTLDDEGAELADVQAAHAHAVKAARALAAETVGMGHLVGSHRVEIQDGDRAAVGSVRFDEAVAISV